VSDQDFFFDDEEQAAKPAAKPAAKQASGTKAPAATRPKAAVPAGAQTVTMTVAGLIGVVALLVGIIIGILIPTGQQQTGSPAGGMPSLSQPAPPLSDEAMQGGLPEGHPDIGGMTGGEATTTPEAEGE